MATQLDDVTAEQVRRWRSDPLAFIGDVLINPETDAPFDLYEEEAAFFKAGLTLGVDGRLPFPELLFGAPKKSGKTGINAMSVIYVTVALGGRYAEGYCAANDLDQSQGRVFRAVSRIIEASPLLSRSATLLSDRAEFKGTGSFIQAIASDYAGAAGGHPAVSSFDELWGYTSEGSRRLWDEMVPVPTRKVSVRLTTSYAGFENESELLESLYKQALKGRLIGTDLYAAGPLLAYWTHEHRAPWQTEAWREQMRATMRPNAYLRMIENRFVSSESAFFDMDSWDACVRPDVRPVLESRDLTAWAAVDASHKRDHTAVVVVAWDKDAKRVRLVAHRVFKPSTKNPIDFERDVEEEVLRVHRAYRLKTCRYDPWQMQASAQRLSRQGVPMEEFPQTNDRLTAIGQNLYDLVEGRNIDLYRAKDLRDAASKAIAKETPRGWRIAKEKAVHKIDLIVALAMAAHAAVERGERTLRALDIPGPGSIGKVSLHGVRPGVGVGFPR